MATKTITMNKEEIFKLKSNLKHAQVKKTPPYAYYQLKTSDCCITAYESGKVVFQGNDLSFLDNESQTDVKQENHFPQCGSDEVGTGDYFGPVCVCACYVTNEHLKLLKDLQIQDSKAINDEKIREIAPILIKLLPHSLLILDNATYNRIHQTNNMVAIKCKLHNQAYVHLKHKLGMLPNFCVIDQFVQATSYYKYLNKEKEVIKNIHFETKAENKYFAVACGSIIARYAFLKSWDQMEAKYNFTFIKGASSKVDQNIKEFVAQYGKEELYKIAKLHFANTKKANIIF